jgi:bifunctional UDP-N-acetylglucosamine pyrophosphorylase/glucosamine-1-phosphate N-acetyltransferase
MTNIAIIILAAGKGTRMKSHLPKAMQRLAGETLLDHLINLSKTISSNITVVVSEELEKLDFKDVNIAVQKQRLGTAHAVLTAKEHLKNFKGKIVVLYVDTPLVKKETILQLIANNNHLNILAFNTAEPKGYGRLVVENNLLKKIVEEKDATSQEKQIQLCNSGIVSFSSENIWQILEKIGNNNASKEFYLTDSVNVANSIGLKVGYLQASKEELSGVNSKAELASLEKIIQNNLRQKHLDNGVTIIAPETVFFSQDTEIGADTIIEPFVVFGKNVKIATNCKVKSFSHLEGLRAEEGSEVGPFARIRPNTKLGKKVKIGNFMELKNANLADEVKASHLSYLGDIEIGEDSNIGAGTIICNYDGKNKHQTKIGKNVFIGSNSNLIAPVEVGDNSLVGAGTTVTKNVGKNKKVYNKIDRVEK